MNLFKVTAIVSSLFILSACNSGNDVSNIKAELTSAQKDQITSYLNAPSGFEFKHDTPLYTALNSLYFFSTQNEVTPQSINPGISKGIANVLKLDAFAKLSTKASQTSLTFVGNHPVTATDTGAPTLDATKWHCYDSTPMTVVVDNQGMTIDGTLTEYEYSSGCSTSNSQVFSYNFNHAHINSNFVIDSGSISDQRNGQQALKANQILLSSAEAGVANQFGKAWLAQWKLNTINAGSDFLTLKDGRVVYNKIPSNLVDFASLDQTKLLAGTVFGNAPASGTPASPKWCRIINIPQGTDLNSQKAQTMIAVNCARSEKRYCKEVKDPKDPTKVEFAAGMQPATSPLAWGDKEYNNAMDNTDLQQKNNKQGHFEQNGQAQNAFTISPYGAPPFAGTLKAVYGYTAPKDANPASPYFNNAGTNSFAGHPGHCQNEMADWATTTGVSFKVITAHGATGVDFLTQNFAG
ncbi:hypothetical protein A9264_09345 [Vibrio sp. UCD-FRSSP16_10]|uniref:hypothetical protein n=1 Tax=unclassified Vibrio TaxID=2614977 RepID=UPI0008003057|nr:MULTISPECIES: hypothetical protein [unclassified Vibrio]OBT09460.1 hypothetical protein A9260_06445 [Vibrio sp. UCD-FRSSP16_30]OBT22139.1 hypothetical protein A9264_09345 [Vibrio sp. UCD-FRSSP16_10]